MYIFKTLEKKNNLQIEEVSNFKWMSIENFSIDNRHIKLSLKKAIERDII